MKNRLPLDDEKPQNDQIDPTEILMNTPTAQRVIALAHIEGLKFGDAAVKQAVDLCEGLPLSGLHEPFIRMAIQNILYHYVLGVQNMGNDVAMERLRSILAQSITRIEHSTGEKIPPEIFDKAFKDLRGEVDEYHEKIRQMTDDDDDEDWLPELKQLGF